MWSQLLEAATLAAILCAASGARAEDVLIGSVFGTHFPGNADGYGGALAWQHTLGAGGFLLGSSVSDYPVGTLSEIDVDVYGPALPHLTVTGGASLGAATPGPGSNTLYKGRVSLDSQLNPAWGLHAGYQYIDLDLIHVNLAMSSVEYRPSTHWGLRAGGGYSVNGTVTDRYADAELDWYGTGRLYAGAVIGRTGYDPANLGEIAFVQRLFQLYLGAAIPIPVGTLTLGLDTLSLEGAARQTLRIGITEILRP